MSTKSQFLKFFLGMVYTLHILAGIKKIYIGGTILDGTNFGGKNLGWENFDGSNLDGTIFVGQILRAREFPSN